jgi:hypothetical protein
MDFALAVATVITWALVAALVTILGIYVFSMAFPKRDPVVRLIDWHRGRR